MASTGVTKSFEAAPPGTGTQYNFAMGHLRAFVVALVVAHHAMLAYHPAAPPRPPVSLLTPPRAWTAYPVIDSHRAAWAGILATFNDIWLMALMFFVSGLFVWASLNRKGPNAYLDGRLLRLGLPFIPAAVVLAPLAYYPTYLQMAGHGGFGDYLRIWISLGSWSAGPVWFLWVLLVFDCVAVLLAMTASSWMNWLSQRVASAEQRPAAFFAWLTAVSALVYVPLVLAFGMFSWAAWGPFVFQKSRILLYLVYFLAGIAVGAQGLERGLLAARGKLARQWPVWVALALIAFLAYRASWDVLLSQPIPRSWHDAIRSWPTMGVLASFVVTCSATSMAVLATFLRFLNSHHRTLDGPTRNSYGVFLTHFIFVSWLGYALVPAELPALAKFTLVLAGSLALSSIATRLLLHIPRAERVL